MNFSLLQKIKNATFPGNPHPGVFNIGIWDKGKTKVLYLKLKVFKYKFEQIGDQEFLELNYQESKDAVKEIFGGKFGSAKKILVEEFLTG